MTFKFYGMTPQDAVTCILGGAFRYNNGQNAAVVQGLQWAEQLAELLRMQSAWDAVGNKVSIKIADSNPAGTPGAKVDVSRLSPDLPPPFDSQEEAQRAAGIWPQEAEPATVRVQPSALDEMAARAASWRVGVDLARDGADAMAYMPRSQGKQRDRIVGASPALGAPYGIDATLAERGSRYGKFEDHAAITMQLKNALRQRIYENTTKFQADQLEAIDMICHKLGRIVNGDPNYADSWVDIAGYAKLVADRLEGVSR